MLFREVILFFLWIAEDATEFWIGCLLLKLHLISLNFT
jgi:hypothetical protein